jgi:hypothetical protein
MSKMGRVRMQQQELAELHQQKNHHPQGAHTDH